MTMDWTLDPLEQDDDGYPTEEAIERVRKFKGQPEELLALVRTGWHYGDWGWHEESACDDDSLNRSVHRYYLHTGGWSGNESLISAMENNFQFWMVVWVQSRRGGHYIFEVRLKQT
jgi:hypothetical protein